MVAFYLEALFPKSILIFKNPFLGNHYMGQNLSNEQDQSIVSNTNLDYSSGDHKLRECWRTLQSTLSESKSESCFENYFNEV